MSTSLLARRKHLMALGALAAGSVLRTSGATVARAQARVASIGWTAADVLLSLGVTPVAAAEKYNVNVLSVDPRQQLPENCIELGLTNQPNLELLHALRPDLIVVDSRHVAIENQLQAIAPVFRLNIYDDPGGRPLERARDQVLELANALDITVRAQRYVASVNASLQDQRKVVDSLGGTPKVLAVQLFMDGRHLNVYGKNSMLDDVMVRLNVQNAWQGATPPGHVPTLGIEELDSMPDTLLLYMSDERYAPIALHNLASNEIWRRLPLVRHGHLAPIPRLYPFGGLDTALQFGRELTDALVRYRKIA
ncbi:ABC transporter substrate-binding protein [Paraburkholderia tropica]|uniref:ABC transporter substrate-binding protein n=1 Tax=Paraburkholderia tropica TaxID=92647 RepID=UPI0009F50D77|nr:ABC transporter substrate-binding protein [Paraburkholderia tropica]